MYPAACGQENNASPPYFSLASRRPARPRAVTTDKMISATLSRLAAAAALLVNPAVAASYNGLAATPQMGWASRILSIFKL